MGSRGRLAAVAVAMGLLAVTLVVLLRSWRGDRASQLSAGTDTPARIAARGGRVPLMIKARPEPIALQPVPGLADVVDDQQLLTTLCASTPIWHPPTVPSLVHELKLWGRRADFTEEMVGQARSGTMIVETLLSDELCRERTTEHGASFLVDSPFGIHVVKLGSPDAEANRGEGHYGQLLMVLGEAGVPLDTPVTTASGRTGTVADLLQDAVMRFAWTRRELDFIACALALWLPPERTWTDQFQNRYSFDELVDHLLAVPWGKGSCGGCHLPYAVVTILSVDGQFELLSPEVRDRALRRLGDLSALLERTQRGEGGWDKSWAGKEMEGQLYIYDDPLLDRITVTGHHLEWIAMAPPSVRPSKETVARAVSAMAEDVDALPPFDPRPLVGRLFKTMLPCSHGAKALCMLRGREPYETWVEYWDSGQLAHGSKGLHLRKPGAGEPPASETLPLESR